ncbi:MAG: hypothetical protein AAF591_15785 [Verrucomicrobiota bacterium]
MSSSHGKRRRRRSSRSERKVDIESLNRPRFAAPGGAAPVPVPGEAPVEAAPQAAGLGAVETPVFGEEKSQAELDAEAAIAAREAAEKVAFDRSRMAELPTLKERPPSREARQRHHQRKARDKRNSVVKSVVLPFAAVMAVIMILAVSWYSYSNREEVIMAPDGRESGARYVDDYPEVRARNDAAWREKRERLLSESRAEAGERDVEAEMKEREVQRRKRELLGTEEPFSDVFRKDKKYLPDPDD